MNTFTFQNQPSHWSQRSLADCFDVSVLLPGSSVKPSQKDFILVINKSDKTSRVVGDSEYTVPTHKGELSLLMKVKDGVDAGFGKALLGSTAFSKWYSSLFSLSLKHSYGSFERGGVSFLTRLFLPIPPMEEQSDIVESLRVSSNFLDRHVKLIDQYNNTCAKLSEAIEYKVLSGEYDKREAVSIMRQAFSLWETGLSKNKENKPDLGSVTIYSRSEVADTSKQSFIDLEDHERIVLELQERISALEVANGSGEPVVKGVTKSRGLRP